MTAFLRTRNLFARVCSPENITNSAVPGPAGVAQILADVYSITLGWQAAAMIAAVSAILQCMWRPKIRPTVIQIAFNSATMTLSALVATQAANLVTPPGALSRFVAAGVVFQVAN